MAVLAAFQVLDPLEEALDIFVLVGVFDDVGLVPALLWAIAPMRALRAYRLYTVASGFASAALIASEGNLAALSGLVGVVLVLVTVGAGRRGILLPKRLEFSMLHWD